MTSTRRWLEARRESLVRLERSSGLLFTLGVVLALCAGGVVLAQTGAYLGAPWMLLVAWLAPAAAVLGGARWYRRRARALDARRLAADIESQSRLRRGSLSGVAGDDPVRGSGLLAALADARASTWLAEHGDGALRPAHGRGARVLRYAAVVAGGGAVLLGFSHPTSGRAAAFWNPLATLARARSPVQVRVDREEVRRGERVTVTVEALGRASATLWTRAPGEPWQATLLALDSSGVATHEIGPLESDQYVRASAAGRMSGTLRVRVALPSFLAELQIVARYPDYLGLADEPLMPGPDTVLVPAGTRIATHGRATVPLRSAGWSRGGSGTWGLVVNGQEFAGEAPVDGSGTWTLLVAPAGGGPLEDLAPALHLLAVRDSAPSVTVPVPGGDTTAPATLKQPVVIDVRDDNRVTRVELVTRRVSHTGAGGARTTEVIPVPDERADRLVLQWLLDLNGRGFLPGDTAYFRVRAFDNAPTPQLAETREFVLRLPTLAEMREAVRDAQRDLTAAVDSMLQSQTALAEETEDAAEERQRELEANKAGDPPKDLPFRAAETAEDLTRRQQQVMDRAEELKEQLRELSEAAKAAGLNDPQFHQQLRDLQRLMDQAMTPELREQLAKMRESLQKLDANKSRQQMQQMSESARQMKENLERSKEMLERAAIEGSMTTLASDADDLATRQREWNEATRRGLDSSLTEAERKMATEADSLAARLDALKKMIDQARDRSTELQDSVRAHDSLTANQARQQPPDSGGADQRDPKAGDQKAPPPCPPRRRRPARRRRTCGRRRRKPRRRTWTRRGARGKRRARTSIRWRSSCGRTATTCGRRGRPKS